MEGSPLSLRVFRSPAKPFVLPIFQPSCFYNPRTTPMLLSASPLIKHNENKEKKTTSRPVAVIKPNTTKNTIKPNRSTTKHGLTPAVICYAKVPPPLSSLPPPLPEVSDLACDRSAEGRARVSGGQIGRGRQEGTIEGEGEEGGGRMKGRRKGANR